MRFFKTLIIITVQLAAASASAQAQTVTENDLLQLKTLNAQFIKNFIAQDTAAHNEIIHPDFVCINSDGSITDRNTYMKNWSSAYKNSGYTVFGYTDEEIRIFGNMALVRAKTVYKKLKGAETIAGNSVYTDTYVKENGQWLCVQAQITPMSN